MIGCSVVIPCRNGAAFLPESLGSVARQRWPITEVLVVDDGSTDGSGAVARRLGATVLHTPGGRSQGPSAARNLGIRAARSQVIAFLDADDAWTEDHLAGLLPLLEHHPEAAVAFAAAQEFDGTPRDALLDLPPGTPVYLLDRLLHGNPLVQSATVAWREAVLAVGGYDETMRLSEDYDLWLRLAEVAPFAYRPARTCRYRTHDQQATRDAHRLVASGWRARRKCLERVRSGGDAAATARVAALLREIYAAEFEACWARRDPWSLGELLALAGRVPDGSAIAGAWAPKIRAWGPLLRLRAHLARRLPPGLKSGIRRVMG
jgi:glycosyltransferase involved in cell wall biosynthesis